MAVVFKNNAKTTLASSLTSSATSVTVADGSAFPSLSGGDTFFCTFDNGTNVEVVKVTARSSNTLTIVRAQDDTTARAFSTGDVAELRLTAGILNLFSQTGVAITDEIEAYLDANGTTFPDNVKAQFGAGNDLQIYHDGSNSYISEVGTGSFYIQGQGNIYIQDDTGAETYARFQKNNAVKLFFDNDLKIATTSTGIDVTGTVTSDGLTVDGVGSLDNNGLNLELSSSNTGIIYDAQNGYHTFKRNGTNALQINGGNGDISFYEDTGTTAKLFWDASAESLGIGLTNPSEKLEVSGKIKASGQIRAGSYLESFPSFSFANDTDTGMFSDTANQLEFSTGGSSRLIIDSSGLIQAVSSITSDPTNTNAYFYNKSGVGPTLSGYQFSVRTGGTPSESLRVDNLGNFLVGTTSASVSGANTTGVVLSANAAAQFSRNGGHSLDINRTQAGELVRFRSAGAIVGTIGVINTNNLTIGGSVSNHSGLQFGTAVITPMRAGSESDAQIDIGFSNARFKDLYLSGTVNAGSIASSVTATTQSAGDNSTKVATTAYTDTAIANLADSAPSTLNTLNELAAALGDDANFSTTVTNSIATKLPLAGGTMTGALNMGSQNITNTGTISSGAITVTSTGAGTTASTFSGNYSASGDVKLAIFERSGGAVASAIEYNDATTDMEFGTTTSHNFSLKTADTRRLTITSAGNATFTGTIDSGDITSTGTVQVIGIKHSNGYEVIKLNDNVYTILRNPEGSNTLYMGDSGDRGNYYDNNHHNFRPFGGGTAWVRILSSGINVQSGGYQISGTTVIDSSRNLTNIGTISSGAITSTGISLFGKTVADNTTNGIRIDGTNDFVSIVRDGDLPLLLNRKTSDGDIALFRKDGSTVGSIGTQSARLTIGTGDTGLRFVADANQITPWNLTTNGVSNGLLDLGNTNNKFKDLYLSGTARSNTVSINGTTVIDSSRNLTNIALINSSTITATSGSDGRVLKLKQASAGGGNIIQFLDEANANQWEVVGRDNGFYIYKNTGTGSGYKYQISSSGSHTFTGDATFNSGFISANDRIEVTKTTGNAGIKLISANTATSYVDFGDPQDSNIGLIAYDHSNNEMFIKTNTTEALRIDSSQNATFAGTISSGAITSTELTVSTSTGAVINLTDSGSHIWKLTTDNQDNFFRVKDSGLNTYLKVGTAESEFATNLNLTSGHGLKINGTEVISSARNLTNIGTISSGAITATGVSVLTNVKSLTDLFLSRNDGTSPAVVIEQFDKFRFITDSAGNYNESQLGVNPSNVLFTNNGYAINTTTVIDSSRNLTNIGTISSGSITASASSTIQGNLLLDADNAEINLKSGIGSLSGAVNWTFNTTGTNYASLKLPYGTRATTGFHVDSGYPITLDATTRINFAIGGNTRFRITNTHFEVGTTPILDLNRNLTNIGTISSGKIGVGANTASYWSQANSLVLDASGNTGLTIKSSTAGNGRLVFTDTTSSTAGLNDGGQIHYSHSDDSLNLRTAGANALTLDSSQNATFAGTISSGAITSTGALTLSVDTTDCINFSSNSTNNNRGISFNSRSALTADYNDGYLRLNNANEFSNGVYTLGNIRADGYVQTGAITINGTTIVDSSRNLSNIGTIASGAITTSGAMIQGYAAGTGEMFTWRNTTSGGKIQLGLQQNDTDGLHHRMYVRAYKGSATASGNVDLIVRGSGGATTTDVLELHSGQRAAWQGNDIFTDAYHPNADVLTTARTINGVSFNGSANITIADATKLALTGGTMTGNVIFSDSGTTKRGIQGQVGANDYWFFGGGATASNSGFVEIAAGDDGSTAGSYEPIYVRQYLGAPLTGTVQRTLTLLDNNGNTVIPNTLTVNSGFLKIAASSTDEGGELTLIRPTSGTTDINIDNFQNYLRVHASGGVWATIDSGGISSNSYQVGGTTVITSARALTNIGTINNTSYHQTSSTTPHHYIANGNTGTYNKTVTYINQNNTSGNTANGMFIEMGRLSDSSSAEVRHFVVGARGGQINFKVDGSGNTTATGSITSGAINTSGNVTLGTFGTTSTGTLILTGSSVNVQAELKCTNGNLHIDSEAGYATYINYYGGTGGIFFGNGASDYRGHINNSGHLNLGSAAASQSGYALSVGAVGVISTSRSIENINNVDATGRFKSTGQAAAGLYFTASGNHTDGLPHARLMESWGMSFTCNDARWSPNVTGGSFLVGLASGGTNHGTGNILATGNITAYYSDERLKTSLGNIKNALNKVQSLDGFRYINNDLAKSFGYDKEEPQLGLSAQQVQKIAPEVVTLAPFDMTGDGDINGDGKLYSKSGENYLTVDYARLVPLLVEAIKEQQKEIEYMKSEIKHLQENNNGD